MDPTQQAVGHQSEGQGKPGETRAEVSKMLSQGMTPRMIAARLGLTTQAVYLHMDVLRREAEESAS